LVRQSSCFTGLQKLHKQNHRKGGGTTKQTQSDKANPEMEGIINTGIAYVFNEQNTGNDYRMLQRAEESKERKKKNWTVLFTCP